MKRAVLSSVIVSACVLSFAVAPPAAAQGCTLGLPTAIENAIDHLVLGACNRHDACWRAFNPCGGPYLGTSWKASCDAQFFAELTAVCAAATAILSFPNASYSNESDFLEDCEAGAAAAYAGVSVAFPIWHTTQCLNGCNLNSCINRGLGLPFWCCPICECWSDQDCSYMGDPGWGTWECIGCQCMLTNSPLVLHLPDYYSSTVGEGRSWWREGFCGADGPTVCLDWRGDGDVSCTAWTAAGSEVAFVVRLSGGDLSHLAAGLPVRVQPWRHFFGNVTRGPAGDFPFANGFEALAAHCGPEADAGSEIDLAACGASLYAWADRNADGEIDPDELAALEDLGIEALGGLRKTGKKDRCGNTFPAESHATCAGRPGHCGTWLDVFFASRYPEAP